MPNLANSPKTSWRWILIAKGIGIFLVVVGHFNPSDAPHWWQTLVSVIYTFHMPLFMSLSGYLYVVGKESWPALMRSKFLRLGFPFVFVAVLFLIIKLTTQLFFVLEHPFTPQSIVELLVNPGKSYMPLLWFMHALLVIFALYPLLHRIFRSHWAIFALFVFLNTFAPTPYPGLNTIMHHVPFFVFGVWLRDNINLDGISSGDWLRCGLVCVAGFAAIYWLTPTLDSANPVHYPWLLVLGLLGLMGIMAISQFVDLADKNATSVYAGAIAGAGFYSMSIYLFHTLFESAVRVAGFQVAGLGKEYFVPVAIVAIAAGMVMPLLLEKFVLRKVDFTRKYLLGLN